MFRNRYLIQLIFFLITSLSLTACVPEVTQRGTPSTPTAAIETNQEVVGIIALGHSGLTGEGSDPTRPGQDARENSWATGTAPEVNSVYQRLIAVHPETEGHVANQARAGASVTALLSQAQSALKLVPYPELVIIQTIDGDIRCDGSDKDYIKAFGDALARALQVIVEASPNSHILVVSQQGRPATFAAAIESDPSIWQRFVGSGVCDLFNSNGNINQENIATLTGIIESYEAEQSRVCAMFTQCSTDEGVFSSYIDDLADWVPDDWNHLNVNGHARRAEIIWPVVSRQLGLTQTPHPFAGDTSWIAYQTNRGGSEGVWLIHPDGTDDHQINSNGMIVLLPDWSPDGKRLAVASRGGETEPLYEYDLEKGIFRQLFACEDPCLGDDEPAYSLDGTKVAFLRALLPIVHSDAMGGDVPSDCGIWIGDIASGEVAQITSNTNPPCDREYSPHWSPDGKQIVYTRDPYENGNATGTAVYVINADGSGERRLTDSVDNAGEADWSPDGEWIVFATYPLFEYNFSTPATSNLYRIHPDGSGLEQLTFNETIDQRATQPRYTPDGKWIIFTFVTPSSRSLWAIPAEGGEPIEIVEGGIYTHGTWQPISP